ncbi:MAG: hypothetical protein KC910_09585 [Candidatus Eremiobacteraeota bacterium]|nr:hypothetical protein [Candidatus Eremiobacteraeota bacterium]
MKQHVGPWVILVAVLVLFAPFWGAGRVFVPEDFLNFVYPWKAVSDGRVHNLELFDVTVFFFPQDVFINQRLKKGDLPLWNPHIFSGHPLVASGQSGLLYPPRLLAHRWLGPGQARSLLLLVHTLWMGLAMWFWLRHRGLGDFGAGVGGLCWMLNGQMASWFEFEHLVVMGPYIPTMFYCIDRALAGDPRWWAGLALAGGLCLHTGHLQIVFYGGLLVIFYALVRLTLTRQWKGLLGFGAAGVGVVLLAAPTVLPFLELLRRSQRPDFAFEQLQKFSPSFTSLLATLWHPDILGNPARGFMLNRCSANLIYPEFACYFGLIPLVLALLALWPGESKFERREVMAWAALALVSLLCAATTPFYRLVLLVMPLLSKAMPGRFLVSFVMAASVLAALGADRLDQPETRARARRAGGVVSGLALVILLVAAVLLLVMPDTLLGWLAPYSNPGYIKIPPHGPDFARDLLVGLRHNYLGNPHFYLPVVSGLALFLGWRKEVLLGLVALDLWLFAAVFNTTVPAHQLLPSTPSIAYLQSQPGLFRVEKQAAAFYNTLTPYGFDLLSGYESMFSMRYAETMRRAEPKGEITMRSVSLSNFDSPLIDAMNVAYLLQAPLELKPPQGWPLVFSDDIKIYRNPEVLPRAFVVGRAHVLPGPLAVLDYVSGPQFEPAKEVALELPAPAPVEEAAAQGKVTVVDYQPDRVELLAELPAPGVVVLSDTFYPGWVCHSSLGELPIYPANGASRAVFLPAGRHQLAFSFEPRPFYLGLKLAVLGLVLVVLVALLGKPGGKPIQGE